MGAKSLQLSVLAWRDRAAAQPFPKIKLASRASAEERSFSGSRAWLQVQEVVAEELGIQLAGKAIEVADIDLERPAELCLLEPSFSVPP